MQYPRTRTVEQADDYHGTRVADPYRWLEDLDAPETAAWIEAQNAVTGAYLATLPGRETLHARLTQLWNYPRVSLPFREGGRLFFSKNSGLQRQSPVYASRGSTTDDATLILDPNALSPDGSVSLSLFSPDPSGRYVAYGQSEGGADWVTVRVRRLADGADLPDVVEWLRYSGVSWTRDGEGFFYTRYPEPPRSAGQTLSTASTNPTVLYHKLGTAQADDAEIFAFPAQPTWGVGAFVSQDGRWLFATVHRGTDPENQLHVADLGDPMAPNVKAPLLPVDDTLAASFTPVGVVGTTAYVQTNLDASRYRVVAVDLQQPARERWQTVIPESAHTLESVALVGGRLLAHHLVDVKSEVTIHDLAGRRVGSLPLPGIGALAGLSGREDSPELFYAFTSYTVPQAVCRYDLETGTRETFFTPDVPFSTPQPTRRARSSTHRRTAHASRCSSRTGRGSRSTGTTRRCSTPTGASTSPSRRASRRRCCRGWSWGVSTRSPTCVAGASTARRGTRRESSTASRTSSTTSSLPPSGWSRTGTPHRGGWPSAAAPTADCW